MSTDWSIYCRTCDSEHYFSDANHREMLMVRLIRHASAIAALAPLMDDPVSWDEIEFRTSYGHIDVRWFAKHHTHDLVPRSEYGEILGQCFARVPCILCNTPHYCTLDKGHAGEHVHDEGKGAP